MQRVLALSSTVIRFPGFPFDLPFALFGKPLRDGCFWLETPWLGLLVSSLLLSLFLPNGERIAEWIEHSHPAFLPQLSPKVVELTHGGVVKGSFDVISHFHQTTNRPQLVKKEFTKHPLIGSLLSRNTAQNLHQIGLGELLQIGD